MTIELKEKAKEEGTFIIKIEFYDEDGTAATPATMAWTLTDRAGTVINSRTSVSMSPYTSTEYILLTGADLAIPKNNDTKRYIHLKGTYNSSTHGNGLPLVDEIVFEIENIIAET